MGREDWDRRRVWEWDMTISICANAARVSGEARLSFKIGVGLHPISNLCLKKLGN